MAQNPAMELHIDIVSDVVCPWCFIGKRRLARAVELLKAERADLQVSCRWLPYFLNPDTPPAGEPYRPFLEAKFGGPAAVDAVFERVRAAGRTVGIDFAFEKIALRANTLNAHRLIHASQARGDADALVERLFVANFIEGRHVGDSATLAAIAAECGWTAAEASRYLASDEDRQAVRDAAARAHEIGVTAVPSFIANGRGMLTGAEPPEVIADLLRQSLAA
jgi:predicted DsbA family dithiol-disulfide isomerase